MAGHRFVNSNGHDIEKKNNDDLEKIFIHFHVSSLQIVSYTADEENGYQAEVIFVVKSLTFPSLLPQF